MARTSETYLGDGVYASFDGFYIWLRATRDGFDHQVALEPSVIRKLIDYEDRINEQLNDQQHTGDEQ